MDLQSAWAEYCRLHREECRLVGDKTLMRRIGNINIQRHEILGEAIAQHLRSAGFRVRDKTTVFVEGKTGESVKPSYDWEYRGAYHDYALRLIDGTTLEPPDDLLPYIKG